MIEPLASFGTSQSYTNLSRSISLSILDQNGNSISVEIDLNHPIEILIPRDPNLILLPMIPQDVLSLNQSFHSKFLDLKQLQSNRNLTISIRFEIHPSNKNLSYLFVYQFDHQSYQSTLFCSSKTKDIHTYYIDNQQTADHQILIFSLQELDFIEMNDYCLNNSSRTNLSIRNDQSRFTSNYELRIYTSGCYYLDENNSWQSNGLKVN
jgi:hypothetical protein